LKKDSNVFSIFLTLTFPQELSISQELDVVKVMYGKLCYNSLMKANDHSSTNAMPEACATTPMGQAIRLIGDVWILLIIINLLRGPKRFNELRDLMGNVSPKTLSQRLKELEEFQFVERRAFAEIPPRVEYHLLEKGRALGNVIEALEQFAEHNLSNLETSPPDIPSLHV